MNLYIFRIKEFFRFLWRSKNHHGVHSPFLFQFITKTIYNPPYKKRFQYIENIRYSLQKNKNSIFVTDFGAKSVILKSSIRKISDIVKIQITPKKQCEIIFQIAHYFQPKNIIELGTSLGVTTLYLSEACPKSSIYSIEGCPKTFKLACNNFNSKNTNINPIQGQFSNILPKLLFKINSLDMVYFDGDHTYKSTIHYFNLCIEHINENSIFIFDDIYWSYNMKKAWEQIKSNSKITVTIDLYSFGIVFFNPHLSKENFYIRKNKFFIF